MSAGIVLTITSLKGGVGKSTITANLAYTLAKRGRRVIAFDCDFHMRSLDLIFGFENQVVYDLYDVLCRGVPLKSSMLEVPLRYEASERKGGAKSGGGSLFGASDKPSGEGSLSFCAAPFSADCEVPEEEFVSLVRRCAEEYDYILIDTPGDSRTTLSRAARVTDIAAIVTTHQPAAVRAAERTGYYLGELGIKERRLIINSFDTSAVLKGVHPGIIETIDTTGMQLLGVIPFEDRMLSLQEEGRLAAEGGGYNTKAALENITTRLEGGNVPLFSSFKHIEKNVTLV